MGAICIAPNGVALAIIKCESCGAGLDAVPGQAVAVCAYCGTRQTLPAEVRQARTGCAAIDFGSSAEGRNIERLLRRADLLWTAGNQTQAKRMYRQVLDSEPSNKTARERLGR